MNFLSLPSGTAFALLQLLALSSFAAPVDVQESAAPAVISLKRHYVGTPPLVARDGEAKPDLSWLKSQENHLRGKIHSQLSNFEKNTGKTLIGFDDKETRKANLGKRATGEEVLTAEQGGSYWQGSISVGTPAQSFLMDFDTVSPLKVPFERELC
jgi:hypothetical protein